MEIAYMALLSKPVCFYSPSTMNTPTEPLSIQPRLDYQLASPKAFQAMIALETTCRSLGLEPTLLELIKLRASQINGCAYCIDLHTREAYAAGESQRRLHLVAAWQESPFFTARERAALAWTEAVTLVGDTHVPDAVFNKASEQFSEAELVNLTLAIISINGWNRLAISFRKAVEGSAL
jgi:AhpD family alkylhydroperoxidase